ITNQARTIRIPAHMVETINRMTHTMGRLRQELGREPTANEVGEAIDLPPERVGELLAMRSQPISLESPRGAEQDMPLGDLVAHALANDRRLGVGNDRVGLVAEPHVRPCSGTACFGGTLSTSSGRCTLPGK